MNEDPAASVEVVTRVTKELEFDRPVLSPKDMKGNKWVLVYDWALIYRKEIYSLPKGFETDGASIPRFLWRLCGTPMDVPRLYAALVHDFIYAGFDPVATRKDADELYRDIQIALDVPKWKAYTEYYALRLFGAANWRVR